MQLLYEVNYRDKYENIKRYYLVDNLLLNKRQDITYHIDSVIGLLHSVYLIANTIS